MHDGAHWQILGSNCITAASSSWHHAEPEIADSLICADNHIISLADCHCDLIGDIRLDWDEIRRDDREWMTIEGD